MINTSIVKEIKNSYTNNKTTYFIVLAVFLFLLPFIGIKSYMMGILCRILFYATIAGGLNAINGYSGQTCLGAAGFFCVGAYTEAILATKAGISFWLCLPIAGIFSMLVGLLLAWPTLRMSGIYLAIVTIGFSEIARLLALNLTPLTGGAYGIKNIPVPKFFSLEFTDSKKYYYLFLALAVLFIFVTNRVLKSKIGRAWMSIREDEQAAKSLGVNTSFYKANNFMYGAFWMGLAGAMYAPYARFIDSTYFVLDEGWNILEMVILGGSGTLFGPILGSVIVNFLTEVLRPIGQWRLVGLAILIIVMMWVRPQGLAGASDSMLAGQANERKSRKESLKKLKESEARK